MTGKQLENNLGRRKQQSVHLRASAEGKAEQQTPGCCSQLSPGTPAAFCAAICPRAEEVFPFYFFFPQLLTNIMAFPIHKNNSQGKKGKESGWGEDGNRALCISNVVFYAPVSTEHRKLLIALYLAFISLMSAVFCKTLFMALMNSPSCGYKDGLHTQNRIKKASLAQVLVLQSQRWQGQHSHELQRYVLIAARRPQGQLPAGLVGTRALSSLSGHGPKPAMLLE